MNYCIKFPLYSISEKPKKFNIFLMNKKHLEYKQFRYIFLNLFEILFKIQCLFFCQDIKELTNLIFEKNYQYICYGTFYTCTLYILVCIIRKIKKKKRMMI